MLKRTVHPTAQLCILITSFLFVSNLLLAQGNNSGRVSGTIKTANTPLEFATVSLVQSKDSVAVTGTTTDSKGKFYIGSIPFGEYFLKFSMVGYIEKKSSSFKLDSQHPSFDNGIILLSEALVNLNEVTVTSQKMLFNSAIDRKVYNVQQDILSKTGTVSDLLQNIPSVQVDVEGVVSLRGSSNVQILIDGKPSPMMSSGSSDLLQQIPANSVDKIEVITNPSAKYKPDGTSGMINIVLKRDANVGLNGNFGGSIGNSSRYNFNASGNYQINGFNIFGSYSYRKDERNTYSNESRVQLDSTTNLNSYYYQNNHAFARPYSHFATLGFDYHLDEQNIFGVTENLRRRGYTSTDTAHYIFRDNFSNITSNYDRRRIDYDQTPVESGTAYWQHNFSGDDHKLRVELNASHLFDEEDNHFTNIFYGPIISPAYDNRKINQFNDKINATVDYHYKIDSTEVLELGYDGYFNKDDYPFTGNYFEETRQAFVTDTSLTNHYIYHGNIHALYGTYEKSFGAFSFLGGLRAEQAFITSDLLTKNISVSQNYFRVYPTLHLAYKFNELNELLLNYSLRVDRPSGGDLNPFPEYQNPRSLRAGNPNLKPEYIHSFELGYQFQNDFVTLVPSIFYRNRVNGFTPVTTALNDSTLLTTQENLLNDHSGGLEIAATANLWSIFNINASANVFYEEIDASNLGYSSTKSSVSWSGNLNCNINLSKSTMIQINSSYHSKRLTPQGDVQPNYIFNFGFRQDLFNEKVSLIVTISDAFQTLNRKSETNTNYLTQNAFMNRDSRVFFFGFIYHFGHSKQKSKDQSLQYDNGQ